MELDKQELAGNSNTQCMDIGGGHKHEYVISTLIFWDMKEVRTYTCLLSDKYKWLKKVICYCCHFFGPDNSLTLLAVNFFLFQLAFLRNELRKFLIYYVTYKKIFEIKINNRRLLLFDCLLSLCLLMPKH